MLVCGSAWSVHWEDIATEKTEEETRMWNTDNTFLSGLFPSYAIVNIPRYQAPWARKPAIWAVPAKGAADELEVKELFLFVEAKQNWEGSRRWCWCMTNPPSLLQCQSHNGMMVSGVGGAKCSPS
ncbi:hypothetical protein CBR_g898 [Chara braunii]|uniref:Uncharacterized protein n=1 Tax=Chara braunii TaxID=69332 RepID=A0A388KCV0_CHABU|nr:hypothetical protein CBR_g898 [Chara braunii]|eukprot:GBG67773.1 hypothetical protein CBR_g898 [Chara braunii]